MNVGIYRFSVEIAMKYIFTAVYLQQIYIFETCFKLLLIEVAISTSSELNLRSMLKYVDVMYICSPRKYTMWSQ